MLQQNRNYRLYWHRQSRQVHLVPGRRRTQNHSQIDIADGELKIRQRGCYYDLWIGDARVAMLHLILLKGRITALLTPMDLSSFFPTDWLQVARSLREAPFNTQFADSIIETYTSVGGKQVSSAQWVNFGHLVTEGTARYRFVTLRLSNLQEFTLLVHENIELSHFPGQTLDSISGKTSLRKSRCMSA